MEKLKFELEINASKDKVWSVLWNDETYREWTGVFFPGSYAVSNWNEGDKILFLGPDKNGMSSLIHKKVIADTMIFRHISEIKEGKEIPFPTDNALESYYLSESDGNTILRVELEAPAEFAAYFSDTFPKAMKKVKEIAERS